MARSITKLKLIMYTDLPFKKTHKTVFKECDQDVIMLITSDVVCELNFWIRFSDLDALQS